MNAAQINSCWRAYLVVLVYRLGGVAGAVRRIVFAWPGEFTVEQIENSLHQLYPGLRPGKDQVAAIIERLRWQHLLERHVDDRGVELYRRCERRQFSPLAEINPQLTFSL